MTRPQRVFDPPGNISDFALPPPKREARLAVRRQACPARKILGMRVDATSYAETADLVIDLGASGSGGMVCVATTHMVMEAHDAADFRRIVNSADRVTPDGVPLVWRLRCMGLPQATRVYGPTLMPEICARAARSGVAVGLYGGSPAALGRLRDALRQRFPSLEVRFAFSPPFRELSEKEDAETSEAIQASGIGVLFVGLGCPKQERWMAAHRERLGCAMVGVGAAFDFLAGAKPQAPVWMQEVGMEWLFRLACEPRRLWRRYLVGNARFLLHLLLERDRI
jgi:N-acetylglucosaminyldiphosphoundecaprenol N-acetyl-beta-D-mannosaminyltransferase